MAQGGTQEGVPLKTVGGRTRGRDQMESHRRAREVGWEPGRVGGDPWRAAQWEHRGKVGRRPRSAHPGEAK